MKKVICCFFSVLFILIAVPSIVFAANENENNNNRDSATNISVNDPVYGSIANGSDSDWYALYVPENGYVSFHFDHSVISSTNTYWEMYLYQPDGVTQIYGSDSYWAIPGNENKKTAEIGLAAGTYYIRVEPYSSSRYDRCQL